MSLWAIDMGRPAVKRVLAQSGCSDGDCPTVWVDDETGTVTIRGYDPVAPARERDVTIPGEVWARLLVRLAQ